MIDLTPAGAAAPRARRIRAHGLTEATLTLRNGEQLLLALVIPVGLLVGGLRFGSPLGLDPTTWPASVLALALWSTSFTSLAITTGFERRYGVLERLAATPITRADLLIGKALATTLLAGGQALVIAAIAVALGWRPHPDLPSTLLLLAGVPAAIAAFAALALALAGSLRAEATLALANLCYLIGALAGIVIPADGLPAPAATLVSLLPTAALGTLLRAWATGATAVTQVLILFAWAVLATLFARKVFRWTS